MPLSRVDQFYEVFEEFITTQFMYKGKLRVWSLNLLTKNTRKNIHDYQLVLPSKYLAYHVDKAIMLADGSTEGPGAIYLHQEMPTMQDFMGEATAYFGKFVYTENGKIVSGVRFGIPKEEAEKEDGSKVIDIQVVYHKKYHPYPVPLTREQELEIQLMRAERRAADAEDNYQMMLGICERERGDYTSIIQSQHRINNALIDRLDKLVNVFRKMAKDAYAQEEPQDCPICLEPIALENLHVTLCGHRVCTVCNARCDKCPLCREDY
jgi:hypothetical protein